MAQSIDAYYIETPVIPNKITASENQIKIGLSTKKISIGFAEQGYIQVGNGNIDDNNTVVEGDGFIFFDKLFVASNNPAANEFYSSDIVPVVDGVSSASIYKNYLEIAESIVFALRSDSELNALFDFWYGYEDYISSGTTYQYALVYIRAKIYTAELDLTTNFTATNTTQGNDFVINGKCYNLPYQDTSDPSDLGPIPNADAFITNGYATYKGDDMYDFGFYLDLYCAQAEYGTISTAQDMYGLGYIQQLTIPYNNKAIDNIHNIDLSGIIKNYVSTEVVNGKTTWYTNTSIAAYGFDYGVYYPQVNNIPRNFKMGTVFNLYSLNSALPKTVVNSKPEYYNWLYDTSFTKYMELEEDIVLSFFKADSERSYIKIGIDFQDGTYSYETYSYNLPVYETFSNYAPTAWHITGLSSDASYKGVHHIKLLWSYIKEQILVGDNKDKVPYSITIIVTDASNNIQLNTKLYFRRETINNNRINVAFLNDMGGFENYVFTGEVETTMKRKTNAFIKEQTVNTNVDYITATRSVDFSKVLKVSSQPLRDAEFSNLIELCKSAQIYIIDDNSDFIFTAVNNVSYSNKTLEDLAVVELEIYDALSENSITQ